MYFHASNFKTIVTKNSEHDGVHDFSFSIMGVSTFINYHSLLVRLLYFHPASLFPFLLLSISSSNSFLQWLFLCLQHMGSPTLHFPRPFGYCWSEALQTVKALPIWSSVSFAPVHNSEFSLGCFLLLSVQSDFYILHSA